MTRERSDEDLAEVLRHALDTLDNEKMIEMISLDAKERAAYFSITNTCKRLKEEYSKLVLE